MFGRPQREPERPESKDLQDVMFPIKKTIDSGINKLDEEIEKLEIMTESKPEIVTVVEKVSAILSPYFISLVGLILYKNNVLLGTVLIAIGILSLLGVSWKDLSKLAEDLKKSFNSNPNENL